MQNNKDTDDAIGVEKQYVRRGRKILPLPIFAKAGRGVWFSDQNNRHLHITENLLNRSSKII